MCQSSREGVSWIVIQPHVSSLCATELCQQKALLAARSCQHFHSAHLRESEVQQQQPERYVNSH